MTHILSLPIWSHSQLSADT